jgi:hypothetical protein
MKMNWGHKILIVYLLFVGGILLLAFKSSQQKFDLVQKDYYGAEIKYQEVINAKKQAAALGADFKTELRSEFLHIILPEPLRWAKTMGEAHLYCISDENGDLKNQVNTLNGEFNVRLLSTMKGNYTLILTLHQNGVDYYFEKKIML